MSFSRIYSAQVNLLKGQIISVETDITKNALNAFSVVGLADRAIDEAKDRVGSALKNSDLSSPKHSNQKTIVSLAPADARKEGAFFDLAIAVSYLLSSEDISFDPEKKLFIGELSLNGDLKPVHGILPIVQTAKEKGFEEIYLPKQNSKEAALIAGVKIFGVSNLRELIYNLDETLGENESEDSGIEIIPLSPEPQTEIPDQMEIKYQMDFEDIRGQEGAKRGLEIAAAGGHNALMSGPPGAGKTLLSKAFIGILPPLLFEDILEITGIHSVAGSKQNELVLFPPFRAPHHTSSYVSVIGGGANLKPGEITLAHKGVLFLDEFPEFDRRVIESLREPLEERHINVSRAKGTARFPANFILIAAMNPCPCGYFNSNKKVCKCSASDLNRYKRKVSGPIMDRIDISLQVENVDYEKLSEKASGNEKTESIRERVCKAREMQIERWARLGRPIKTNSEMGVKDIDLLDLSPEIKKLLNLWPKPAPWINS